MNNIRKVKAILSLLDKEVLLQLHKDAKQAQEDFSEIQYGGYSMQAEQLADEIEAELDERFDIRL